jgi:uncharacterized membrane protein
MRYYNQIAGQKISRIEALSDGVFAIALTLLALEIKAPPVENIKTEMDLIRSLSPLIPKFLCYFLSFMMMGILWTGQSAQLNFIEKYDRNLNWNTFFFLLTISLLPFTTAFLGEHITFRFSVWLYWLNILLSGIMLYSHWTHAVRKKYSNLEGEELHSVDMAIRKRILVAQGLYFVGALQGFINPYLSIVFITAVQLNYPLARFIKT